MKRFFALLLSLAMILQLLPGTALAARPRDGYKTVESNEIPTEEVDEEFEIIFDFEDKGPSKAQKSSGKKLLTTRGKSQQAGNNGKGNAGKGNDDAPFKRRRGQKLGQLPDAPNKKHFYKWVDRTSGKYVDENTIVEAGMTLAPVGMNEEDLSFTASGVSVEVPENTLPEYTEFSAVPVSAAEVANIIGEAGEVRAVDLTFFDANIEKNVQPIQPVEVTMSVAGMDTASLILYHIKDDGSRETVSFDLIGDTIVFNAKSFSIYVVTSEEKIVTVNFYDDKGNQ